MKLTMLFTGLSVGSLLVVDPYISTYLTHRFNIAKLFPFEFSVLIFLSIILLCLFLIYLVRYFPVIVENKELLFIVLFISGYQTTSLQLGIVDASDIVLGVFLLIVLVDIFVGRKNEFIDTPINLLNLLLLIILFISLINNNLPSRIHILYIKTMFMFFLMFNFLCSKEIVLKAVRWLIIITTCSALIAIFQEIYYILTGDVIVGFIPDEKLQRMFEPTSFGLLLRVPALMLGYRIFASILGVTLIITVSLIIFSNTSMPVFRKKANLYVAASLMFLALLFTFSKDVLMGFFIALVFLLTLKNLRYFLHYTAAAMLLIAIVFFLFTYLPGQIDNINYLKDVPQSERERIQMDREGIEGFLHGGYFFFGKGASRGARYTVHTNGWPAHNAFILIADELGIFGLIIYISMFVWIIFRLIALNLVIKDPAYLPIARGFLGGIIIYIISAQFQASYMEPFLWIQLALIESTTYIFNKISGSYKLSG